MIETILFYDNMILNFIQNFRTPLLDKIMPLITSLGNVGAVWIFLALILLISKKYRKIGITLSAALILCFVIGNLGLKPWIGRIRPFDANHFTELLIKTPKDFSFPSGHTLASFTSVTVLISFNKKFGFSALILGTLIAFSRLYLYVHYPTDVLAGIVFGIILGKSAVKIINIFYKQKS